MITRDESIRQRSNAQFLEAIKQMANNVAMHLRTDATLPDLRITSAQVAAGCWAFPVQYRPILERARAELIVHMHYELSGAQLHLACLQGAALAGKLYIDGVLQRPPNKRSRSSSARTRDMGARTRMSLRHKHR